MCIRDSYKSDTIGTEHLLLSLLRDDENIAAQILQQFSVSYDAVREELDLIISGKAREGHDDSSSTSASASSSKGSTGSGSTREKTVSYTHLRAHETVLDLVCRLLLEKKKHK
eukprot:TRINITY_DN806_c0_g1_i1.p1 TRINITY_DN806_c0_g1~~TRINITY_DN806_c0_g1_i1.p1  ORF type:complete len:113 (+),score=19.68 TRINITY_DN806_c0_g1_i1:149-487(+)